MNTLSLNGVNTSPARLTGVWACDMIFIEVVYMKRILWLIIALAIMLCSCESADGSDGTEAYWTTGLYSTRSDGFYYIKTQTDKSSPIEGGYVTVGGKRFPSYKTVRTLCYFDAVSGVETIVCPKPNCPHTDPESCFALGFENEPVIQAGEKIYWLKHSHGFEDGEFYDEIIIMRAEKSGVAREEAAVVKDRSPYNTCLLYADGKIWFISKEVGYDASGSTGEDSLYLCSYDPASGKYSEKLDLSKKILDGDSGQAGIRGFFDGKIIIELYKFPADLSQKAEEYNVSVDPKSLDIKYIDGDVKSVSGGAMAVSTGEDCEVRCDSGEVYELENDDVRLIGDMMILSGGEAVNYKTGQKYKYKASGRIQVVAETEDGYIVSENVIDENGFVTDTIYKKLAKNELFEEE